MTLQRTLPASNPEFRRDLQALSFALDDRIAEMRRMLSTLKPMSDAGALRALREAYPDVPLETRISAFHAARR